MRVLHVISSISRQGGGPSRSSQGLVAGLCAAGVDAWLMTLQHGEKPWIKGVDKFINGGKFEDALVRVKPDLVHVHGIWQYGLHRCVVACHQREIPYVIAPRGMLETWSLKTKWLKKRIARWLYQDHDLRMAAALHATAESEAEQLRRLGFENPVIISPNGVNVPEADKPIMQGGEAAVKCRASNCPSESTLKSVSSSPEKSNRVLFVSRMHPKKGVLELVEAWAKVRPQGWQCELVYTLNGDEERAYEAEMKKRIVALGLSYADMQDASSMMATDFILTGPLNDREKWSAYARTDLFVLPTYSENFGIVVAEALWAGVPVITTKGTPWSELVDRKCGWWIDIGVEPLMMALREAMSLTNEERAAMGARGRKLVEEKYTWKAVCTAMIEGYRKIS